jgi:hypothetical protein
MPDTINTIWECPGDVAVVYNGTMHCHLEGGNIVFRGRNALMKLNRDGFAVYPRESCPARRRTSRAGDLDAFLRDGTMDHVRNFLDSIRSAPPKRPVASSVAAANAAHFGNLALRRSAFELPVNS